VRDLGRIVKAAAAVTWVSARRTRGARREGKKERRKEGKKSKRSNR